MDQSNNLIEFATRRLRGEDKNFSIWGKSLLNNYQRVSRIAILPKISFVRKSEYILLGVRGWNRLTLNTRKKCHLSLRARDLVRLNVTPSSFEYDLSAYKQVYRGIMDGDNRRFKELELKISKTFDLVSPRVLLASSTIDPMDRMWIKEANNRGIRTVCLQHGLYSKENPWYSLEEDIVGKYIAFDEMQAEIVSRNIPSHKISNLGFRSVFRWAPTKDVLNIGLVGEDFECYGLENKKILMIEIYKNIVKKIGINKRFNFYYKPHPAEIKNYGITGLVKRTSNVDNIDIFLGFTSTLLKDMASKGKLSIQILSKDISSDSFQENGYCLTLENDEFLEGNLKNIFLNGSSVPNIVNNSLDQLLDF